MGLALQSNLDPALVDVLKGSYIRATFTLGMREFIRELGGDADALFKEAGIPLTVFDDVDQLASYPAFVALLEMISKKLNRPSFALEWSMAEVPHFAFLGPVAMLAQFAKTYREWAAIGLKYWALHSNGCNISLFEEEGDDFATVRFTNDPDIIFPSRQIAELTLANLTILSRNVMQKPDENPLVARFQHLKPSDISLHEQIFRCPIEFDALHTEIIFPRRLLDLPMAGSFAFLKPALTVYMKHRIRQMPVHDQSATRNTMIAIASTLGSGKCNIVFIAESLGMNVKKMQRVLAAENTNFADVIDKVRENTARRMLVESNAPIAAIAGLLDYSAGAAFTLAFTRWAGVPPLAYRKRERLKLQAKS